MEDKNLYLFTAVAGGLITVIAIVISIVFSVTKKKKVALNSEKWQSFPLIAIEKISHDVKKFTFGLPSETHVLGLPIGQHISLKYTDSDGKEVQRSYTPTSSDDDLGRVDFVIKVYYKNVHPKFPDGGKMSQHLDNLKIGESILMKGPKGHLEYKGCGKFSITQRREKVFYRKKKIGMVAGGTGITPMLQVIRAILKNPQDKTEMWLIFANQTEEDILLRDELESLQSKYPTQFHLFFTLDRPPSEGWEGGIGFINPDMCRKHLPPPNSTDTMLFVCGPPPMIKYACEPAFKELGFEESEWFSF